MKGCGWCRLILLFAVAAMLWACAAAVDQKPIGTPQPPAEIPQIGAVAAGPPSPAGRTPAVARLTQAARQDMAAGNPAAAFTKLERAIRIDPADPLAWHLLARVQLTQDNPQQAEQLAKKSNLLIIDNPALEKQNWKVIAEALDRRGLTRQARQARSRSR